MNRAHEKHENLSIEERRSRLERRANVVRSRLLRTIDALDVRRHQVTELGQHAKRLARPVGGAILGIMVVTAGVTFGVLRFIRSRREERLDYRVSHFLDRFRQEPKPSFFQEAIRKVVLVALGVLANELTKRMAKNVLAGRSPDGHLMLASPHTDRTIVVR